MGCNCNNSGLFSTEFDHTFDKHNSRCQDTDINELEELKKLIEELLDGMLDEALKDKLKDLENKITQKITLETLNSARIRLENIFLCSSTVILYVVNLSNTIRVIDRCTVIYWVSQSRYAMIGRLAGGSGRPGPRWGRGKCRRPRRGPHP